MYTAQAVRCTGGGYALVSGRPPPTVWKCRGSPDSLTAAHSGSQ